MVSKNLEIIPTGAQTQPHLLPVIFRDPVPPSCPIASSPRGLVVIERRSMLNSEQVPGA